MINDPIIICNPGFGNAPYLQAIAVALEVQKHANPDATIVVPHIYGEKQKRIIDEEFGDTDTIILDEQLGNIYKDILYSGLPYANYLTQWLASVDQASLAANTYIAKTYTNPIMEIARAPQLELNLPNKFCSLFARQSDILQKAGAINGITIDEKLLQSCITRFLALEESYQARFITQPGSFAAQESNDTPIPPTISELTRTQEIEIPAIYITVSGIPELHLAPNWSLPMYTNDPARIPGATFATPHILGSNNIVLHFARAGWGSIWRSLLSETPIVVPTWDPQDDPEIYFNIKRITELGIGIEYRGQSEQELLMQAETCKTAIRQYKASLMDQFGTIDGTAVMAQKIADMC